MSLGITDDAHYTAIASAIRAKVGTDSTYAPSQMASAIEGIQAGGGGDSQTDELLARTITSYVNSTAKSIGTCAFAGCSSLSTIEMTACERIDGMSCFGGCASLTNVSLPACTSIFGATFCYLYNLSTVDLPVCSALPVMTFCECTNLTSVNAPACTSVGSMAFQSCTALTAIDLPACEVVDTYGFAGCTALVAVSIPVCTMLSTSVFANCANLISLYLDGVSAVTSIIAGSNYFDGTPIGGYSDVAGQYGSIFVPASLADAFRSDRYWSYFSSRIVGV